MSVMDKLENPVLKRELKIRIRAAKLIPAIALRCACLGLIFLLVLLSLLGKGLLAFILAETFLVLLFIPGAVCNAFASNAEQRDSRNLALTRLSSGAIILGKLVGANLYTFIVVALSALVMCTAAIFHSNLHIWHLIRANMAILILAFASAVIGLVFSVLFRRSVITSATLSYILILLLISSVVVSGPLIKRTRGARASIAKVALYANPLIMTSRALGKIDIMRTTYMYNLADPIVSPGFSYPDWYSSGLIYLGVSCLLLISIFVILRSSHRFF